jgi:hypothetical protein
VVTDDMGVIRLRGAKERMVVAVLALDDQPASPDRVADALWGDRQPRRPDKAVQTHVLRLRQVLGSTAIETIEGGYRLARSVTVDARMFESAVVDVLRESVHSASRAALLGGALDLWRLRPMPILVTGRQRSPSRLVWASFGDAPARSDSPLFWSRVSLTRVWANSRSWWPTTRFASDRGRSWSQP